MAREKRVFAGDCETDPFLRGRIPFPFIWGLYDGKNFTTYDTTKEFVDHIKRLPVILYMHNGGKFDFMYLLPHMEGITQAQIINGRIVKMMLGRCELRDSYSAVPEALGNIKKDKIDMWKLESDVRSIYREEILRYLYGDCRYLHELMVTYRQTAGKRTTIASNAMAFSSKLGIHTGKTNHRFDAQMRRFFFGGRTQCFQPGTHHNIQILDIHSAYPFAMLHDHATGDDFHWQDTLDGLSVEQIQRAFITLTCTSDGAFPKRRKVRVDENGDQIEEGGLFFPHEYNRFNVTGWEYLVAKEFNLIRDVQIDAVGFTNDKLNFKPYVEHWYEYKKQHSAKDASGERLFPNEYTVGKYMMNSLYGKLAMNPARYYDYKIVPAMTPVDDKMGWQLGPEFEGHAIHCRPAMWKYRYELGVEWKAKAIYHNVATGASITGFTRAHLLRAMCTVGRQHIIYCDTDSLFTHAGAPTQLIPQTDQLGDWELEDKCAPVGHFAGKKLYGVITSRIDKDTGKPKQKIASKGSKLAFEHIESIMRGEAVKWESQAPSFSMKSGRIPPTPEKASKSASSGETPVDTERFFVRRKIRATAQTT